MKIFKIKIPKKRHMFGCGFYYSGFLRYYICFFNCPDCEILKKCFFLVIFGVEKIDVVFFSFFCN